MSDELYRQVNCVCTSLAGRFFCAHLAGSWSDLYARRSEAFGFFYASDSRFLLKRKRRLFLFYLNRTRCSRQGWMVIGEGENFFSS